HSAPLLQEGSRQRFAHYAMAGTLHISNGKLGRGGKRDSASSCPVLLRSIPLTKRGAPRVHISVRSRSGGNLHCSILLCNDDLVNLNLETYSGPSGVPRFRSFRLRVWITF